MKYILRTSYEAHLWCEEYDEQILLEGGIKQSERQGGGMGFGERDNSFEFATQERREQVMKRLREAFPKMQLTARDEV